MYETSSNLNVFEKEEKHKEDKELKKQNSSLFKTASYKKSFKESAKKERNLKFSFNSSFKIYLFNYFELIIDF